MEKEILDTGEGCEQGYHINISRAASAQKSMHERQLVDLEWSAVSHEVRHIVSRAVIQQPPGKTIPTNASGVHNQISVD
jgi:hypothetical protein